MSFTTSRVNGTQRTTPTTSPGGRADCRSGSPCRVHGTRAYGDAIETAIDLARRTATEIRQRAYLELIREPDLSVVLFRRIGWQAADYTAWADGLLDDQVAFLPPTIWEGETVARFAFLHPHTSMELVAEILDRMAAS